MNDRQKWVMEWFAKGDHDLRTAETILRLEEPMPDIICFHAQQCAEKYLKGFLSLHGIEVRRTHDLVELITECSKIDLDFLESKDVCEMLTDYAIEPRYPDISYEYSVEEAEEAYSSAARIRQFVRDKVRSGDCSE